jgi:hypothetical protein
LQKENICIYDIIVELINVKSQVTVEAILHLTEIPLQNPNIIDADLKLLQIMFSYILCGNNNSRPSLLPIGEYVQIVPSLYDIILRESFTKWKRHGETIVKQVNHHLDGKSMREQQWARGSSALIIHSPT